jgi:hypothetical protein
VLSNEDPHVYPWGDLFLGCRCFAQWLHRVICIGSMPSDALIAQISCPDASELLGPRIHCLSVRSVWHILMFCANSVILSFKYTTALLCCDCSMHCPLFSFQAVSFVPDVLGSLSLTFRHIDSSLWIETCMSNMII